MFIYINSNFREDLVCVFILVFNVIVVISVFGVVVILISQGKNNILFIIGYLKFGLLDFKFLDFFYIKDNIIIIVLIIFLVSSFYIKNIYSDWGQQLIESIMFLVFFVERKQYQRGGCFLIDVCLYLRFYDYFLGYWCRFWNCFFIWVRRVYSYWEGIR